MLWFSKIPFLGGVNLKRPKSISLDEENLKRLDSDKLTTQLGRSGIVRVALNEYYEKRESEKVEQIENSKGER